MSWQTLHLFLIALAVMAVLLSTCGIIFELYRNETVHHLNSEKAHDNFIDATNGGWGNDADGVVLDAHTDYIESQLRRAQKLGENFAMGETFSMKLENIPGELSSPYEIVFPMILHADDYGLHCNGFASEQGSFTRLR